MAARGSVAPAAAALANDDPAEFWYQAEKYVADALDRRDDTSSNDRWRHVGDRIARGALHQRGVRRSHARRLALVRPQPPAQARRGPAISRSPTAHKLGVVSIDLRGGGPTIALAAARTSGDRQAGDRRGHACRSHDRAEEDRSWWTAQRVPRTARSVSRRGWRRGGPSPSSSSRSCWWPPSGSPAAASRRPDRTSSP